MASVTSDVAKTITRIPSVVADDPWPYIFATIIPLIIVYAVATKIPDPSGGALLGVIGTIVVIVLVGGYFSGYTLVEEQDMFSKFWNTSDTFGSLFAMLVFLAGPIIDVINGQYKYSIPSIVSLVTSFFVKFVLDGKYVKSGSKMIVDSILGVFQSTESGNSMLGIVFLSLAVVLLIAVPTGLQLGGNQTNAIASAFIISVIYLVIYLEGAGFVGPTETDIQSWGEWWGDRSSKIKTQKETLNEATRKVREELLKPKSADTSPSAETSTGGTRISLDDPCDVPGFTWLRNSIAPSSIIISQTILLCHLMEAISNRDTETVSDTLPLAGTSLISFGLQYWLFLSKEKCGYTQKAWAPLIGYGISIVAAATSYLGLKYLAKEQFTTNKTDEGVFSNPVHKPKAKTQKDKDTTTIKVDSPGDTSLPVDDQDQFVCEAYRDGELITSTIVE